jgi:hypothetical protein
MNLRAGLRTIRVAALCAAALPPQIARAQRAAADRAAIVQRIDAANANRYEHVLRFTDTEHYSVFRGDDETHPAAEMIVHMTYRKGAGKTYEIVSQSGSEIIQKFGLEPLLANEKQLNEPAVVKDSWFTSANYEMRVSAADTRQMDGRDCIEVEITPKRKAPNMIDGKIWVDPRNGTLAEVEGTASKSPSPFAGTTHMMRQYTNISGYAMATHARAESHNPLFGRTVVTIDYSDYELQTDASVPR